MSLLSPRLQLRVAQKQILTPGPVQMVTVLQLNRLELKEMISQEISQNPVLEETAEAGDELTPEEVQQLLERERINDPSDQSIMEALSESVNGTVELESVEPAAPTDLAAVASDAGTPDAAEVKSDADPFDEIDFG